MKKLLIILMLPVFWTYGQQKPVQRAYTYTRTDSTSQGRTSQITKHIRYTEYKGQAAGEYPLELRLLAFSENVGIGDRDRMFTSEDLSDAQNFMNNTSDVSLLVNMKFPIRYALQNGHIQIDSLHYVQAVLKQLADWQVSSSYREQIAVNAYFNMLQPIHTLHFSSFTQLDPQSIKNGKYRNENSEYTILDSNRKHMLVSLAKKEEHMMTNGTVQFDAKHGRIISSVMEVKVSQRSPDGRVFTGKFLENLTESPVVNKEVHPLETEYLDMLVQGSGWSDALMVNQKPDSAKVYAYIAKFGPRYGQDRNYVLNTLNKISRMENYEAYKTALSNVADLRQLRGTYHLSNVVNTDDFSWEKYRTVLSLMNDEARYRYLQHTFSQGILGSDSTQLSWLDRSAGAFSEQEHIAIYPMLLWKQSMREGDAGLLIAMRDTLLNWDDRYWNQGNTGRYALLIQKSINQLVAEDDGITAIIKRLERLAGEEDNPKRYIQQAHLAYANYMAYEMAKGRGEDTALGFLKLAADHSPKSKEEDAYDSYYDRFFLQAKENYTADYVNALQQAGQSDVALQQYEQEFLRNPASSFDGLQAYYLKTYPQKSFSAYFGRELLPKLPDAPNFLLKTLDDQDYASDQMKGRWMVVDFWGTWCGPCVEEMPKLNAFHLKDKGDKVALLTIACYDTKEKVEKFLAANDYQIPVLMSNSLVEKDYKVSGYPSKYIISPEGKLIATAFQFDWESLLNKLVEL